MDYYMSRLIDETKEQNKRLQKESFEFEQRAQEVFHAVKRFIPAQVLVDYLKEKHPDYLKLRLMYESYEGNPDLYKFKCEKCKDEVFSSSKGVALICHKCGKSGYSFFMHLID